MALRLRRPVQCSIDDRFDCLWRRFRLPRRLTRRVLPSRRRLLPSTTSRRRTSIRLCGRNTCWAPGILDSLEQVLPCLHVQGRYRQRSDLRGHLLAVSGPDRSVCSATCGVPLDNLDYWYACRQLGVKVGGGDDKDKLSSAHR